jgi:Schlafen, AlbA_2
MEFVVVFDTNTLLSEHDDCIDFVREFTAFFPPRFRIALDSSGYIEQDYSRALAEGLSSGSDYIKDSTLFHLTTMIEQMKGRDNPYVVWLDINLAKEDEAYLESIGCGRPIEKALFGIAKTYPTDVYVALPGKAPFGNRGYTARYSEIQSRFLFNNYNVRESLTRILRDSRCPEDYEALKRLLGTVAQYKVVQEGERNEYKRELNDDVRKDLPIEACGMLNKDGGYIFIGVEQSGGDFEIKGFKWAYKAGLIWKDKTEQSIVSTIVDSIFPSPAKKVLAKVIEMPEKDFSEDEVRERMLVAIYVQKGGGEEYCCRSKHARCMKYVRVGTQNKPENCSHACD